MIKASELCVAQVPLFSGLSDDELFEVAARAQQIKKQAGEVIFRPGDSLSQLLVVHSGSVRITHLDTSGSERLIRVLNPGDFIGEASFVAGLAPEFYAIAMTNVALCTFDHREFDGLVAGYPSIAREMLRSVMGRLESAERFIAEVADSPVAARVARYLLDLPIISNSPGIPDSSNSSASAKHSASGSGTPSQGSVTVQLPIAKKDVASLLGITPESLSRQLSTLQNAGVIIVRGRSIEILDPSSLEAQLTK